MHAQRLNSKQLGPFIDNELHAVSRAKPKELANLKQIKPSHDQLGKAREIMKRRSAVLAVLAK